MKCLKELIVAGAKINKQDQYGTWKGHTNSVKEVLKARSNTMKVKREQFWKDILNV